MSGSAADAPATRLLVLMYHRIGSVQEAWEHKYCVGPARFAQHMRALADRGYRTCSIEAFDRWLTGDEPIPDGSFLLTFDDGYLGVYEHAMPVLAQLGWQATVFLVSGLTGREDAWMRRERPASPAHPLLDRPHIEEMARHGFSFQSHTRTHVDLTRLDAAALDAELAGSRADVEQLVGKPVTCLAYPYGHHNDKVVEAARAAGYTSGFSVLPGFNRRDADRFRIRRIDVFGMDSAMDLVRKMRLGSNDGSIAAVASYVLRRAARRLGLRRVT